MSETIYLTAKRAAVRDAIRKIPGMMAGREGGQEAVKGVLCRIGFAALTEIREAFVVKAAGGTDESGLKWKPLKRETVAYSRRHPGVLWPGKKRAPFAPSWMLTKEQRKRWWALYNQFGGTAPSGAAYHGKGVSHGWAAARAWQIIKAEGATTLLDAYGDTKVDILRDTGLLLNSLTPGIANLDGNATIEEQVFQPGIGEITIGTRRKLAAVNHKTRPLWPKPQNWPDSWWARILDSANTGLIEVAKFMLERALR